MVNHCMEERSSCGVLLRHSRRGSVRYKHLWPFGNYEFGGCRLPQGILTDPVIAGPTFRFLTCLYFLLQEAIVLFIILSPEPCYRTA